MKILTWNINGIRAARRGRPLKEILDSLEVDVICLQETKVTRDMLDEVTAVVEGYNSYFSFSRLKTGYSGVATFCKDAVTPLAAEEGISPVLTPEPSIACYGNNEEFTADELEALDAEGRTIITEHRMSSGETVVVINVYCPRADKENQERVDFKMKFYRLLQNRAEALVGSGKHVIVLGDINTSHKRIDHCDPCEPELFDANPGRQWLNQFLAELHQTKRSEEPFSNLCEQRANNETGGAKSKVFVDSFRYFYPNQREAFTNWSTVTSARQTNYGTRIDYIFANVDVVTKEFIDCIIRPDVEGSDHCPVVATLRNPFVAASKPPSLCTKYMPEFAGRQQKLQPYFVRNVETKRGDSSESLSGSCSSSSSCSQTEISDAPGKSAGKRSTEPSVKSSSTKRLKIAQGKQNGDKGTQKKLFKFFGKANAEEKSDTLSNCSEKSANFESNNYSIANEKTVFFQQDKCPDINELHNSNPSTVGLPECSTKADQEDKKRAQVAAWKSIFKGPRPAPLCPGHQEPCVLRTVKIKGPNQGKQFYCCARPQGHASNSEARCSFFKWVK